MRRKAAFTLAAVLSACSTAPPVATPPGASSVPGPVSSMELPALQNVSLGDAAARDTIGPAGGDLLATDGTGTTYRLAIPAGALREDVEITMVPIRGVAGLPDALRVAAGVHLLPEGLGLWRPAELEIDVADEPAALVPVAYREDLSDPFAYPADLRSNSVTLSIVHFSGYLLLAGTDAAQSAEELGLMVPWGPPPGPFDQALADLAGALAGPAESRTDDSNAALRDYLDLALKPAVEVFAGLGTWGFDETWASASSTVSQGIELWDYLTKLLVLSGVTIDQSLPPRFEALVLTAASHGVTIANTACAATPTGVLLVFRLPEVFHWRSVAEAAGVAGLHPSLASDFIEHSLCAAVEFNPNLGIDFTAGVEPGGSGTLTVQAGIRVDGTDLRHDALDVTVTPQGAMPADLVTGGTDAAGTFARTFTWDPASSELRLDVRVCLPTVPVCQDAFVVRGTPPPGPEQCPRFEYIEDGRTQTGTDYSEGAGGASGRIAGDFNVSITAFDGLDVTASGVVHYLVEPTGADRGPFDIMASYDGAITDDVGGLAMFTVTVAGVTKSFTSQVGGRQFRLEFPLTVSPGDVFKVAVRVDANASTESNDLNPHGYLSIARPPEILVYAVECS